MNLRTTQIVPGFMVLHGNRLEELRDVLSAWLQREPLGPLEDETVLVQSNGIAQWFKMALARDRADGGLGISAAVNVQLPGRFLWTAYRAVLGQGAVPAESPFDESRLTWRLLRLLPAQLEREAFAPLRRYLGDDKDTSKRYQLARRLADLFDQYQVYRADWLDDWAAGHDVLRDDLRGTQRALPDDQQWQAELWRAVLADVDASQRDGHRAAVHARFMQAAMAPGASFPRLPRRIVVFGMSSLPQQTLEALAALSGHCQVLLVVMNPCRHYWADIVEDRELLRAAQRRQAAKPGAPETPELQDLHLHANPLLAAWGKQGRDYIRMLDAFDQVESYRARFTAWEQRVDLFTDPGCANLLASVQQAIFNLDPLPSPGAQPVLRTDDDSIMFHVAHGPLREVEILHDALLARFAAAARRGAPLQPRDVIVMVPDIGVYAPYIEAVFGRIDVDDPRFIPFTMADRQARGNVPLVMALEHLLGLDQSRFAVSELLDLIDVPAVRRRFGLADDDLPTLRRWIEGAGVRWGLHGEQRAWIGLPPLKQNSWRFGLRRMLLGYAVGEGEALDGIEPYDEVAGLDAALVGPLADLLAALEEAWLFLREPATPAEWGVRLRRLLQLFFDRSDAADTTRLERLGEILEQWEDACAEAAVDEPLPVAIVADAWLEGFDHGELSQRFMGGAVSFGTLMPMRAIPFRVVCLLGMNDGAYPRARPPMDFDLMALPGGWHPGDRSRREDDRYLFLEALLSARDALHIGWVGRHVRDNSERPPSVLVGQLRDYLAAGWLGQGRDLLDQLTVVHPLQPFSESYFANDSTRDVRLFTYAGEWRRAHDPVQAASDTPDLAPWRPEAAIGPAQLRAFLRYPVRAFFNMRLGVYFDVDDAGHDDLEPFVPDALQRYQLVEGLMRAGAGQPHGDLDRVLADEGERLRRSGRLPMAGLAEPVLAEVTAAARSTLLRHARHAARFPHSVPKLEVQLDFGDLRIEDWLSGIHCDDTGAMGLVTATPSALRRDKDLAADRLVGPWIIHLLAHAAGCALTSIVVGGDVTVAFDPMPEAHATALLAELSQSLREGMLRPLPVAAKTAFAFVLQESEEAGLDAARRCYDGEGDFVRGESAGDPYLMRAYPDFDCLLAAGFRNHLKSYRALYRAFREEGDA
ncbi:exodeoxyribonuclease V subunit gamma [Pinirhizobacter soli]|uniref:exodeoxyribonuclease V subunit gamma n=1 Tax=Pinirhizobacter soli TaxID=2786953 RepID=UPI00202AB12C|nr:exodeoxyribonuclease V subunit gamma [Pinirhizobacter soli]